MLGELLADRGLRYELVVNGGGGLLLLGVIERPTEDLDALARVEAGEYMLARPIPTELQEAIADVANARSLRDGWFNAGPTDQLTQGLPAGFRDRVQTIAYGGLILHLASRFDQICFKLYAATDGGARSKHLDDLQKLAPTDDELTEASMWVKEMDGGVEFREFVDSVVARVKELRG